MAWFSATSYAAPPLLVIDAVDDARLPKNFRIMDKHGMQVMGSAQFTRQQLIAIKNTINAPIIIVDLRQEAHGFINGLPVSWYGKKNWANKGKAAASIIADQQKLLATLNTQSTVTLYQILKKSAAGAIAKAQSIQLKPRQVYSEQQLAAKLGLGYKRFYVTDHSAPSSAEVDRFKAFIKTVPKNTWLYFHCRAGVGRTTTFMVLYQLLQNGKHESLADILHYQIQIGGKDLMTLPAKTTYKYILAEQRLALIKKYYQLARQPVCIKPCSTVKTAVQSKNAGINSDGALPHENLNY